LHSFPTRRSSDLERNKKRNNKSCYQLLSLLLFLAFGLFFYLSCSLASRYDTVLQLHQLKDSQSINTSFLNKVRFLPTRLRGRDRLLSCRRKEHELQKVHRHSSQQFQS